MELFSCLPITTYIFAVVLIFFIRKKTISTQAKLTPTLAITPIMPL